MSRKWLFIQAHDVWMFRGSRPFAAGQSFTARSMFPPNPQTMQGVLRSHVVESSGVRWADFRARADADIRQKVGAPATADEPAEFGDLVLRGPFVARRNGGRVERLVPAPADVARRKTDGQPVLLRPVEPAFESDLAFEQNVAPLALAADGPTEPASGWLTEKAFAAYLRGEAPSEILPDAELFAYDDRIGLALDYGRRRNKESHLYHAAFIRPHDHVGLLVEVNADYFAEAGLMKAGGEGRAAYFETVNYAEPTTAPEAGNLKAVVLTPTYFQNGYAPADWSPWLGPDAILRSHALHPAQVISGWDVVRGRPKPLYHYVAPGSVYYFQNAQPTRTPFTETPPGGLPHGPQGFGAVAWGAW